MDLIGWYVLFAVTTSLTFMYEVFSPVMQQLEIVKPDDNMVEYKFISYFVYFLLGALIAPLLLPVCLIPSFSDRFRKTLLKTILEP
jgi:hypothetical protein